MNNPYWENICAIAERQRAKGLATYGKGLEHNQADAIARIEHLQEELVDALMYCEWIKDAMESIVRCKDCKHWLHMEDGCGDCTNPRFHLPGHADPTMEANGFCSCGERKNDG